MMVQIVYPGAGEVIEFNNMLNALEHVVETGKQRKFLIKPCDDEQWFDGAEYLQQYNKLFEPA